MSTLIWIVVLLVAALLLEDLFVARRRGESVIRRALERRPLIERTRRGLRVVLVPSKRAAAGSFKGKT